MDEEAWENEGGPEGLYPCRRCGKMKPEYDSGLCLKCFIELYPPATN